jgi:hypothetical protein
MLIYVLDLFDGEEGLKPPKTPPLNPPLQLDKKYIVCLTSINIQKKKIIQFSNQHFFSICILIYDIYELGQFQNCWSLIEKVTL